MSGKVIQTLRKSSLASMLSEAEMRMLASCGRIYEYLPEQNIFSGDGHDERLYLLRDGKVDLRLIVNTETGQCRGKVHVELNTPGEPFGWAAWINSNHIGASARALGVVSVAALDLAKLEDTNIFFKLSLRMSQLLYARLQEYGICPPNIQALLQMKHLLQG
ncbi:MAG: cyclic nucleotide-binding domain-containing protein [Chloroflexi bacterium]|nr:cyclic nucleotide-binding domain-containing protein [Chloroflexota bacterium]